MSSLIYKKYLNFNIKNKFVCFALNLQKFTFKKKILKLRINYNTFVQALYKKGN